ncbi:MAG TPA: alcohol dehydrogenase catalytic domain-containing protein [Deltaproteobacteria bacterium]|nr:alcohol dehydrogenase catalytic domain-containing protein [Deltaproteobacteria bacterium]HOM29215.1 alcohol dehydrogenase catalytic domain-containing protein [Deltaproteobacteria bacterium]
MKALVFSITVPQYLVLQVLGRLNRKYFFEGPFATVSLRDVPEPALPGREWVKVRVRLCGLCGSDINLLMVKDSPMASPFTSFPCIFGHELAGEVVETGADVHDCKVGDLVTVNPSLSCVTRGLTPVCRMCSSGRPGNCERFAEGAFAPGMFAGICKDIGGGFAEYMVAHTSQVFRVPDGVSPESAVLTEPLAVGLQAVLDNLPKDGDAVLVIGGGVIGAMVVKAIRGLGIGCSVTVVEPSAFHREYARRSGADHVVASGILDAAVKMAGARAYKPMLGEHILQGGFDKVFDTVGHSDTIQQALIATSGLGTVSLVGIGNKVTFDPTPLWLKLLTLKGCYGHAVNEDGSGKRHAFSRALELVASSRVHVEDMLTHTFPITRYRELLEVSVSKGSYQAIKTAVRFF